jgi:hypothetical protein
LASLRAQQIESWPFPQYNLSKDFAMKELNKIEPDDIKRLGPEELVRLLDLLLRGEARNRLFEKHGIFVPFQINVSDGGRDGRWDAPIKDCEYIPRPLTYYQCKAEALTEAKCRAEILRSDEPDDVRLKEKVAEVLEKGGAYVFFSSHPCPKIDERIAAAHQALANAGRPEPQNDCIEFLDANRIAAWVNTHVAAFAYMCQKTMRFQMVGLRAIRLWAEDPIFQYEFQSNKFLSDQIENIRKWLSEPRRVARISGPSGLGKTRLGFEVFNCETIGDDKIRAILAGSVAYTDVQFYGEDVFGWIDQICLFGLSGIIVVDNCSREWHQRLSAVVNRASSRLSLLTLDYEAEELRTEFLHVPLEPEKLRDVVPKILRSVPELAQLNDAEIDRIAVFAQGFPQIAILTAQAGGAVDYKTLNNQGRLAERLLWGRESPDDRARDIIRCLSLFSAVGVSGSVSKQLEFVRRELCDGISEYHFNRLTSRFKNSRILQAAGDYIMVTPAPLAAALAAEWLEYTPHSDFVRLLPEIETVGLTSPFTDQLKLLDFSEKATALCTQLLGPTGPLSSAEVLNSSVGSQIFRALSELNPLAATESLYRIYSDFSPAQMRDVEIGRRDLVWALEKLCWSVETFPKAAEILLKLAAGENEKWSNNATGHLDQLFHVYLSGTQMPAIGRLPVLKKGLTSPFPEVRRAAIGALGAGLEHNHFMRSSGAEVRGTRLPERDWQPKTYADIWNYWKEIFRLLRDEILKGDQLSTVALDTLGNGLGGLFVTPLVKDLEEEFRAVAQSQSGFWPAARDTIRRTLELVEDLPDDRRQVIERWLSYVQPHDLEHRLADIVSNPGWHHEENEQGHYEDVSAKRASEFADELASSGTGWVHLLPQLLQGPQQQAWAFGARYAELSERPRDLIDRCLAELRKIRAEDRNPQLVRGMISTLQNRAELNEILDGIANDAELRPLLVPLTTAAIISAEDFNRVAKCVEQNLLPTDSLRPFAFGSVTRRFADDEFHAHLAKLIENIPQARPAIFEVVFMHCFADEAKWPVYRDLLERLTVTPEVLSMRHDLYHWRDTVKKLVHAKPVEEWTRILTDAIITEAIEGKDNFFVRDTFAEIVALLLKYYPKVVWPIFEQALQNKENRYRIVDLLGRGGSRFDDSGSPLWNLPADQFKAWVQAHRDLISLVLHFMSLYSVDETETGGERFRWHPHALVLIELGEKDSVKQCISSNLLAFGSTGSRVPYLDKRIALVKDLMATENPELRAIAESVVRALEAHKEFERKRDAEHAAGIY